MSLELLHKAGPVRNSVHDLIRTRSSKLDSVARAAIHNEDAREEGTRAVPAPRSAYADEFVDETLRQTFPASDPPSWWAGPPS